MKFFKGKQITINPYLLAALLVGSLFSISMFKGLSRGTHMADLDAYINIAQNLYNGGILYKTAIDVKSMGFFFLFYGYYALYALFFTTTQYYYIYQAIVLSIYYFFLFLAVYRICLLYTKKNYALISMAAAAIFLANINYMVFFNQHQIALGVHLVFLWYALKYYEQADMRFYFTCGLILGLAFALSLPYLLLTLSIPTLILYTKPKEDWFKGLFVYGGIAFLGFILALLPFFLYFYFHKALGDWWHWNIVFIGAEYDGIIPFWTRIKITLERAFIAPLGPRGSVWGGYLLLALIIPTTIYNGFLLAKGRGQKALSSKEYLLLILSTFGFLAKLTMVRGATMYNIYLVPFVIFSIPPLLRAIRPHRVFPLAALSFCLWSAAVGFYVFKKTFIVPEDHRAYFLIRYHSQNLSEITAKNPNKRPTVITAEWQPPAYSTRWKLLYYNALAGYFPEAALFQREIYRLRPECVIGAHVKFGEDPSFQQYMEEYYINVAERPYLFIRKDKINEWNL